MSNPNRRGAMALVSASLCLTLAALFYFTAPAPALTASAPIAVPAAADWGLSFPTEGESPVGNASAEDLAQYGAYYLGDTSQKVLYLTFDCGYENGYTAQFYRPPQGKYSVENLKQAQQLGYTTVFWSLAYVDWNTDDQPSAEEAYAKLLPRIHDGAIVLLHSTSATNAAILDDLLTKWEEMGYTFASLDQLPGLA